MKKIILSALVITLAITNIFAQNGAIFQYKFSSQKGMSGNIKAYYSDKATRIEFRISIPGAPYGGYFHTIIINKDKPTEAITLDDKNKTYSISEIPESKKDNSKGVNYVVKIGGMEPAGGFACTKVTVTKGTDVKEYWVTKDIPSYEKYVRINSGNKYVASSDEYTILNNNKVDGFIVKKSFKDAQGVAVTMELINYETKQLDDALFETPKDYKQSTNINPTGAPVIDQASLQNMTPEERKKYIEEMKKQAATQTPGTGK